MQRRHILLAASSLALAAGCAAPSIAKPPAQRRVISLATGSKGGGFLLYGQAMGSVLGPRTHLDVTALETQGTAENINRLVARQIDAALLVMGPAFDAWTGQAQWAGNPVRSMRALFPMYETPFHVAALAKSGINSMSQLAGKRVGVGPARGTAEGFFRGLMLATGLQVQLVNGSPSDHAQQLSKGEIDAFWFGAGLPVPAFVDAGKLAPLTVFGLTPSERDGFIKRFPYFAPYTVPANTYVGQTTAIGSVAVWNFAAMHVDAPEDSAYWLTRLSLENSAALTAAYPAAVATSLTNLAANTFMPFHPGALRYFKEQNIQVATPT